MAIRYAVATGNWSATATWDGGTTLPTSADDVYANNRTVTIDQDVTVLSLRNTSNASPLIAINGTFAVSSARTISATSLGFQSHGAPLVTITGTANTVLNGTINPPASSSSVISHGSSGTLTHTGNISSAGLNNTPGISASSGPVISTGTMTGGTGNGSCGCIVSTGINAHVTVIGNVIGGAGGVGTLQVGGTNAILTVTGNVTGFTPTSVSTPVITLGGNNATKWHSVVGTITATVAGGSLGCNGIVDTNTSGGGIAVGGSLIDSAQGDCAVNARRFRCIPTLNTVRQHANNTGYPSGGAITYGSLDYIPNNIPIPANVRLGTVYGNNSFTGTAAVPPASSVAAGAAVDNTVGTAAVSLADIISVTGAQFAAALKQTS